jgi:LmbE family N-acetylglucosaminyl deacetylase
MNDKLKLMCVFAHPDDESMGVGGTLARYAAEGVETYLVTATRGQRGWPAQPEAYPGPEALGRRREKELRAAGEVLGLRRVDFLDYMDGELDQADPQEIVAQIVAHLRRIRPHVVITFGPEGAYGHPDHIAISQFTTAAIVCAADPNYSAGDRAVTAEPHRVSKLYYRIWSQAEVDKIQAVIGREGMLVDGVERQLVGWPAWTITTRLETEAYWSTAWQSVICHQSQLKGGYDALAALPEARLKQLWQQEEFYRAFSLVNGRRQVETDLFAGLRRNL